MTRLKNKPNTDKIEFDLSQLISQLSTQLESIWATACNKPTRKIKHSIHKYINLLIDILCLTLSLSFLVSLSLAFLLSVSHALQICLPSLQSIWLFLLLWILLFWDHKQASTHKFITLSFFQTNPLIFLTSYRSLQPK